MYICDWSVYISAGMYAVKFLGRVRQIVAMRVYLFAMLSESYVCVASTWPGTSAAASSELHSHSSTTSVRLGYIFCARMRAFPLSIYHRYLPYLPHCNIPNKQHHNHEAINKQNDYFIKSCQARDPPTQTAATRAQARALRMAAATRFREPMQRNCRA
jgi:hypothetical protein